jgi:hypothetical protein
MSDLDEFLSQSLPPVPDHGFSTRVMRRVWWEQLRQQWKVVAAVLLFVAVLVAVAPLRAIGDTLGEALPQAAGVWALSLGAWLVVVSLIAARQLSRM